MYRFVDFAKAFAGYFIWFGLMWFVVSFEFAIVVELSAFCAIFLNAIGQSVAGMLRGMNLESIRFLPFELDFSSNKLRVCLARTLPPHFQVGFSPSGLSLEEEVGAWRQVAIAGPLTSFLLAVFAFWVPGIDLTWFFYMNLGLFLASFIPSENRSFTLFRRLRKSDAKALNLVQGYRLGFCMRKQSRPREWPAENVSKADAMLRGPAENLYPQSKVIAGLFIYEHLVDLGENDNGMAWLEWLESSSSQSKRSKVFDWRDLVTATRACHYALWNRAPELAVATLSEFGDKRWIRSYPEWKMATALIKLSRGNQNGAMRTLKSAHAAIAPWLERSGSMQMKAEWLDIIEQRINDASTHASAPMPMSADKSGICPDDSGLSGGVGKYFVSLSSR